MWLKILIASFIFLISFFFVGRDLEKPFWGEHDWNGVRYGNIARNFLREGIFNLKFAQVENSGSIEQQKLIYYTHYPPLLPITISFSYQLFGVSEFSTRLVPVIATSATLSLIFLIGALFFGIKIGLFASLIALLTPMSLYFGKNVSHEPLALFFILLSFLGFLLYKRRVKYSLIIFILGLVLAELTAWAGYFLIPAITLTAILSKDSKRLKFIIPFWIVSLFLFVIHILIVYFATGTFVGGNLLGSLFQRSGLSESVQPEGFNLIGYINRLRLWFSTTFTFTLTSLAIFGLMILLKKFKEQAGEIIILGIVGVIYLVVFSNAAYIHNYLIFYFLPFLALSASSLLFYLQKKAKIYLFVILLVPFLIIYEKEDFLVALSSSQVDKMAVELGRAINNKSKFEDIILVSPAIFANSADNFLKFYSDRQIKYIDDGNYKVRVLVDQENQKFEIINK